MSRVYYLYIILLLTLPGCLSDKEQQEREKWRITLDPQDKRPYGTYIANESVHYYFPDAAFEPIPKDFHYDDLDNKLKSEGRSLIIFEGLDFKVTEVEWGELLNFVKNGNEIVVFCSSLDKKIEKQLSCYKLLEHEEENTFYLGQPDFNNKDVLYTVDDPGKRYGYTGRSLKSYFYIKSDSAYIDEAGKTDKNNDKDTYMPGGPDTLGYANNQPDFIRYRFGAGHITFHAAPLVLTNYFLLQPGNIDYLTAIWRTLPQDITKIYTHHYYKRNGTSSGFSVLWQYPATRWALLLGLLALLMYVLFEGKRKQRVIAIVAPIKNDSVSFAETVGRLYYNKGNHANLAAKMSQQFLEWVRINYLLNTNLLNEQFITQLTIKSGQPETMVRGLIDMIHEIKMGFTQVDDAYLYQLYNTIQQFYKNKRT